MRQALGEIKGEIATLKWAIAAGMALLILLQDGIMSMLFRLAERLP